MLRAAGLGQPDWRTRLGRVGLLDSAASPTGKGRRRLRALRVFVAKEAQRAGDEGDDEC